MALNDRTDLAGRAVIGFRDEKIGKIDAVYGEDGSEEHTWARVKPGLLGLAAMVVPLHDAELEDEVVRIFYEKEHVKAAPSVEPDGERISEGDAVLLHRHYGLEPVPSARVDPDDDIDLSREPRQANPPGMEEGPENPITQRRRKRAKELGVTDER